MKEIKNLFDVPTGGIKIVNAALAGAPVAMDNLIINEKISKSEMEHLERLSKHMVLKEAVHFPNADTIGHIDRPYFLIDSLADLEYPLFIPNTPLNTKPFAPLITLPEDLDECKAKPEPTNKEICDKRNSAKKRDKVKVKAQKKARRLNRRKV